MELQFTYDADKEFHNFYNSFKSVNHFAWSKRQKDFFSVFPKLTKESARQFSQHYIADNKINVPRVLQTIKNQWSMVGKEFFKRADGIYKTSLPQKSINVYLTVHDRCSYSFKRSEFFIHFNLEATNKTIMHELWHWYFYFTVGKEIETRSGIKIYNDIKEALTVLLNVEFNDLLGGAEDKGYPQHGDLREFIVGAYEETNNIYKTINRTLQYLKSNREEIS
ncbi:MAG: hypothetical protein Q8P32_04135 [Candidatus Komeilibacteria bacterium]|nr:hypothetical protein [Candidatus Komeilibacteria bacterium]